MKKLLLTVAAVAAASASLAANYTIANLDELKTAVEVFAVDTADLER